MACTSIDESDDAMVWYGNTDNVEEFANEHLQASHVLLAITQIGILSFRSPPVT